MGGTSAEDVKKHLKTYWFVFVGLLFLTVVTVAISYYHLPIHLAVLVAMFVASIKASLVALFFMHLNSEKTIIYATIGMTFIAFLFCMLIPIFIHG